MQPAIYDASEPSPLEQLQNLHRLDAANDGEFDSILAMAKRLFAVPTAIVYGGGEPLQAGAASGGMPVGVGQLPPFHALCETLTHIDEMVVIEDMASDPRFADHASVSEDAAIRFYAGVPLRSAPAEFAEDRPRFGTLCLIDTRPRLFTADDREMLKELARLAEALPRARMIAQRALILSREAMQYAIDLERQHLQLREAESLAGIATWRIDLASGAIHWSDEVYKIHGLPIGAVPSMDEALTFYPADRRSMIATLLERGADYGESFDFESDFLDAKGTKRRVRSIGKTQIVDGKVIALIGVFQDVTERYHRELALKHAADTDALTGVANRACFDRQLARWTAAERGEGERACLILLDLDGFKSVNDTFGHAAGDEVLRMIAHRLCRVSHGRGLVARLGGDEFGLLIQSPYCRADIEDLIGAMLSALRHNVEDKGDRRYLSATIGAAFWDERTGSATELMRHADVALYEAKRQQRGIGRIYGSDAVIRPR